MDTDTEDIDLRQYLVSIRRWAWLLTLGLLVGAGGAYGGSLYQTPVYQAETKVLVIRAQEDKLSDLTGVSGFQLTQTYSQLMVTQPILDAVSLKLGFEIDEEQITVRATRDTQLITVLAENPDPVRAARMANTLIQVFIEQIDQLQASRFASSEQSLQAQLHQVEKQIASLQAEIDQLPLVEGDNPRRDQLQTNLALYQQIYSSLLSNYESVRLARLQNTPNVVQVEAARPPTDPVRPRPLLNLALGGVVGLLIAGATAFLIEYLDTTLKTPEDVVRVLDLPVIGFVGEIERLASKDGAGAAYVAEKPRSPIAEGFRSLRTNLEFAGVDRPLKTILVTSAGPGEGKTTIAVNLAIVIAQGGKHSVLLDADLRRPSVHQVLAVPNRRGLSDIFRDRITIPEAIQAVTQIWKIQHLAVVTSGGLPPNPAELLASARMGQFLAELRDLADVVVIDSPPFMVTDASVLAARVDGVLLVVEPGRTQAEAAIALLEQLNRAGARVVGVVLNRIPQNRGYYYHGGYQYYSYIYSGENGSRRSSKNGRSPGLIERLFPARDKASGK